MVSGRYECVSMVHVFYYVSQVATGVGVVEGGGEEGEEEGEYKEVGFVQAMI